MSATNPKIRTRFAPSPTGFVHIGNFRTALFAFLFARNQGGVNILRVEDTDQSRKLEGAIENMISVMSTLGVEFDEGPQLKEGTIVEVGEHGPYTQSQRLDIYKSHADLLISNGKAYYCFCSPERLDEVRKEQVALKKPPMYDRHCRKLSAEETSASMEKIKTEGRNPVVRMAIPEEGTTEVDDMVFGKISYDHSVLDDQVLMKSDGFPTYHMAVVIDDHLMEISHVIRGDDWIPSTPKHILLYKFFGWEAPRFAHLPLILNPDKTKLSKRQGDVAVEDFLNNGYLPETLVNFVALLGWNPKSEQEIFSKQELIQSFDLAKVNKAGAVFDHAKLDWMSAHYIKETPSDTLLDLCVKYWKDAGVPVDKFERSYLLNILELEKDRLKKLSDITEHKFYFDRPEIDPAKLVWKKSDAADAKTRLGQLADFFSELSDKEITDKAALEEKLKTLIAEVGSDNGSMLWPLRVSLTGLERSPGPFEVASVIASGYGKQEIIDRVRYAESKL